MAVKVRRKSSTLKTKPKTKLTTSEKRKLKDGTLGCIWPKEDRCPAVNGKDTAYGYQNGCRAGACSTANANYYKAWRDKKTVEAEKAERSRKRKRAATANKRVAKKAVNGKRKSVTKKK